jgi:two-component system CheB/CheR fusion protein
MSDDAMPPVVGLGASAGGIEAFREFFGAMPGRNGLVFLVVLHLAPERVSMLVEILGHWTSMPVHQAADGITPEPEHVYVIPPNAVLTIRDGVLRLRPCTEPRHINTAIDALFASMALQCGENAVGIVLSGTGSDGALGLKAIKECGGITLAQGPAGATPEYSGMPSAAIATGAVDLTLPVAEMPARILSTLGLRQSSYRPALLAQTREASDDDARAHRAEICAILREQVGHDFSQYKEQTFLRRVQRRMHVTGLAGAAYMERLQQDRNEIALLFRDLLIGVTSFFRDNATFQMVEDTVLPRLFKDKSGKDQVRIWVPGCATGEEAYSLAIMLVEFMDNLADPPQVQIFATDIDGPAIDIARLGRYPHILLRDVPADRVARFFTRVDDNYVVSREVRNLCTFSAHSVIRDPPFSRMNLISCRNLLIYLDLDLQAQVIPAFHYSLVPGGLLLLGASESVARYGELFAPVDRRHRIYQRCEVPSPPLHMPTMGSSRRMIPSRLQDGEANVAARSEILSFAHRRIRDRFSPAFAVVTADGDAVHFSPRTGKYLEIPSGPPTSNLIAQARAGLRLELRTALRKAADMGASVERENVLVQFEGGAQTIVLTIEPLPDRHGERLFLVVFADDERSQPRGDSGHDNRPLLQDLTIEQLERELREVREQNQSIAEEYETALEELKSANEELHSVNEELQSSNEELETSKEEIQSVNEELQTVNHQLTCKVDELDRASSDLRNVFDSTQVPTVFLDRNLIVRSFTPAVTDIYNLIPADHGRPLTDIVSNLRYDDLRQDVGQVLSTLEPIERRVERRDGKAHHLMRILPYRSSSNLVEGALITFVDVTSMVLAEQHDKLMVDELNHRVKNMLTVVISLATQTRRGAHSFSAFWDAFMGRIQALATAYELLSRDQWTDIPLLDVLREELGPYMPSGKNPITLHGPDVFLRPKGALAFGMVVHELATNALKYGALSSPSGTVAIGWTIEAQEGEDVLLWYWREANGPRVTPPSQRGFGLSLIERSLSHEMNGEARLRFEPEGLHALLKIPFDSLVVSRATAKALQPS